MNIGIIAGFTCDLHPVRLFGAQLLNLYIPLALLIFFIRKIKKSKSKHKVIKITGATILAVAWWMVSYMYIYGFSTCNIFIPINPDYTPL